MHDETIIKRMGELCGLVKTWSKDRSRKTSAVIMDSCGDTIVAIGWNGFPRGIDDEVEARHERPAKYLWTEHAERNAIYNAARKGVSTLGCLMFMPWYPCADCARAIIQAGIFEVYCVEPDWDDPRWADDFKVVKEMLDEADVAVTFVDGIAPEQVSS